MSMGLEPVRLKPTRYDELERTVVELLEDYRFNHFPLDIFGLCNAIGVVCVPYFVLDEDDAIAANAVSEDGFTIWIEGHPIIVYNEGNKPERIRFTLAHELAHVILDHGESTSETESEANWFAEYLLAPTALVVRRRINDTEDVMDYFNVGNDCASYVLMHAFSRIRCQKAWKDYEQVIYAISDFPGKEVVALEGQN